MGNVFNVSAQDRTAYSGNTKPFQIVCGVFYGHIQICLMGTYVGGAVKERMGVEIYDFV